jgi:hypothetical protein
MTNGAELALHGRIDALQSLLTALFVSAVKQTLDPAAKLQEWRVACLAPWATRPLSEREAHLVGELELFFSRTAALLDRPNTDTKS